MTKREREAFTGDARTCKLSASSVPVLAGRGRAGTKQES